MGTAGKREEQDRNIVHQVGGILVLLLLPETLGSKLPDTMEEALALGGKKGGGARAETGGSETEAGSRVGLEGEVNRGLVEEEG